MKEKKKDQQKRLPNLMTVKVSSFRTHELFNFYFCFALSFPFLSFLFLSFLQPLFQNLFFLTDETLRGDLHEMLVPAALRVPWSDAEIPVQLNFYFIEFIPIPDDRIYCPFGLFVKSPLPREAETMNVDLHLAHGRIVKAKIIPSGTIEFDINEVNELN